MSSQPSEINPVTYEDINVPLPRADGEYDENMLARKLSKITSLRSTKDVEKSLGDSHSGSSDSSDVTRSVTGLKWFLICVSLYLSAFMYGLDTTIAADVQAAVVTSFGNVEQLTWMGTGFSLGSVATILPIGAIYGKFNQKWIYIASLALFEIGSALCGAAPTMDALIVGRVIAGIGGSGVYLGVLNYLSMTTTNKERGTYIALIGVVWGLGCILGPVIGGAFSTSSATWRWAFYINLVIAALSVPIYVIYLPSLRPTQGITVSKRLAHIDWIGFVLSAGFWTTFTMVLTFAGAAWAWNDARTIVVFVVFGVLLVLFTVQQAFSIFTTPEHRSFPVHLLKSKTQVLFYFGTSAAITALFIPVYYIPVYFQFVHGDSALQAAVRLLPFVLIAITTNMITGVLLPKFGYYMPLYLLSGIFMLIGGSTLYTVTATTPMAQVYGFSILLAVGAGMTLQTGYTVSSATVSPHDIVNAISLQNVSQIGSIVIALVISGQIFQSYAFNNLSNVLAGQGFSVAEIHAAVAGSQSAVFEAISPELRLSAVVAITSAISKVYILVITAGAFGIVTSVFMKRERLFV